MSHGTRFQEYNVQRAQSALGVTDDFRQLCQDAVFPDEIDRCFS